MIGVTFPSSLPQPSLISQSPGERRLMSTVGEGMPQVRTIQRDFKGDEKLRWEFTEAQATTFMRFWRTDLLQGGRWFIATWPRIFTQHTQCRFKQPPVCRLLGHDYWEVTVESELRGLALPPQRSAMVLGLHFDDDIIDVSGNSIEFISPFPALTALGGYGYDDPGFAAGVFDQAIAYQQGNNTLASGPRSLTLNDSGEWQISMWMRPTLGYLGHVGGFVFELIGWGYPEGATFSDPVDSMLPPPPTSGQFRLRVQGGPSDPTLAITFFYTTQLVTSGAIQGQYLGDISGAPGSGQMPNDADWHHVGIAGDADGTRLYVDGTLVADDGNYDIGNGPLRAAGLQPLWNGTSYTEQSFHIGGAFAGTASNEGYANWPFGIAISAPFNGDIDDVSVVCGVSSVTFTGASITVPAAPFER